MSIVPPVAGRLYEEEFIINASFCFCVTYNSSSLLPLLSFIVAFLSSVEVFGFTLRVTLCSPASPLFGKMLHHSSARVLMAAIFHSAEDLNEMVISPSFESKTILSSVGEVTVR